MAASALLVPGWSLAHFLVSEMNAEHSDLAEFMRSGTQL